MKVFYSIAALYVGIGCTLASVLSVVIPALSMFGWAWYVITWPYQLLGAVWLMLPIAPSWLIPYLFNF